MVKDVYLYEIELRDGFNSCLKGRLLIPTSILLILLRAIMFLSTSSPKISSFEYAMASTSSSTRSSGNAEKWLEYDNNTYGISIQYPSSWESSPEKTMVAEVRA